MSPNAAILTVTTLDELPKSAFANTFVNPKNGDQVVSQFTIVSARALVRHHVSRTNSNFANDLANKVTLSAAQTFYFFKIAEEEARHIRNMGKPREAQTTASGEYIRIQELFTHAKSALKRPVVTFDHTGEDGTLSIKISKAPDSGKNPGCLYVKANGEYAGKITLAGEFFPIAACSGVVKSYLAKLAQNPEDCARSYGKRTGRCCFCSLELTDDRSVTAGYGPICAGHWGLPWGAESNEPF